MDLHTQSDQITLNHTQLQWTSTSFQSADEVLSVSSLVPSTVLTLIPNCNNITTGNPYSAFPPSFNVTEEKKYPETFSSEFLETYNQETIPTPNGSNPAEVEQRKPSDGQPLEDKSISLMLPKEEHHEETGMLATGLGFRKHFEF